MRDRIIAVYEKEGGFIDRYLVVFDERNGDYYVGLSLSASPGSPQGVSSFSDVLLGEHLGKEISFEDLPEDVREHVLERVG